MKTDDEGFTLIELLAIILIIGVLAAIAIPTFLNQRDKAYRTAMKADLHALVVSETAWNVQNNSYTPDVTLLGDEGYRQSAGVTAHVAVAGATFVACTKHSAAAEWLVYDSTTSSFTTSPADCV